MGEQKTGLAVVESVLDYNPDSPAKTRYVSYRACGFTIQESLELAGIDAQARKRWLRDDELFQRIEQEIASLRKVVGLHYAFVELLRNFRLVLDKDARVIRASLDETPDKPLSERDFQYLLRIRSIYTPDQIGKLQQMLTGQNTDVSFNFTQVVLGMARRGGSD